MADALFWIAALAGITLGLFLMIFLTGRSQNPGETRGMCIGILGLFTFVACSMVSEGHPEGLLQVVAVGGGLASFIGFLVATVQRDSR